VNVEMHCQERAGRAGGNDRGQIDLIGNTEGVVGYMGVQCKTTTRVFYNIHRLFSGGAAVGKVQNVSKLGRVQWVLSCCCWWVYHSTASIT
jgi:hypothetical protein